jgi:hypothetical protein
MGYIFCLEHLLLSSDRTKLFLAGQTEEEALSPPDDGNGFCIRNVLFVIYVPDNEKCPTQYSYAIATIVTNL